MVCQHRLCSWTNNLGDAAIITFLIWHWRWSNSPPLEIKISDPTSSETESCRVYGGWAMPNLNLAHLLGFSLFGDDFRPTLV